MNNKETRQKTTRPAGEMHDEVMTLSEVAAYLRLAEKTVLRMVHKRQIPCAKVASQWRFLRSMIDDWLIAKMHVLPRNDLARLIESAPEAVPLQRLLKREHILLEVKPGSKAEVLHQLARPLVSSGLVGDPGPFVDKLLEREALISTGVGRGVALPHLRHPRENPVGGPLLIVGICREGTDFQALDGRKTRLFFLLCTDSEVVHLRLLAKVNRLATAGDAVERLVAATSIEEVEKILVETDQKGARP